jgi:hypothetical protein
MEGKNELLALLELDNAETLDFWSSNRPKYRLVAPIPSQLTKLTLEHVVFTPKSLQDGQRHFLPRLKSLRLNNIVFLGPMRKYFHCPKLEHLSYSIDSGGSAIGTILGDIDNPYQAPTRNIFDQAFFQETLALKSILLHGTRMDEALVSILAYCPLLLSLKIEECRIETFTQSFLENLTDPTYLPTLRELCFDESWPLWSNLPYEDFMVLCGSKRPWIYMTGNGLRLCDEALEFSDGDQSQTDPASDSDEDSDADSDGFGV